jgi:thiol-disulfide isomerase/thioredoxin
MTILSLSLLILAAVTNLTPINEKQLPVVIQENPSQVVLVNFWATWCIPCREEFPDLVRLHQERQASGFTVISVSIDDPENTDLARAFLERHHTTFPAYIATTDDLKALLGTMDPAWTGAIPATFIFDRQRNKTYQHIGQLSYEEMKAQVDSLK